MHTHSNKTQNNKKHTTATHTVSQQQNPSASTFQFIDKRPETIQLQKLQEMANNYSVEQKQTIQCKDNKIGLSDNLKSNPSGSNVVQLQLDLDQIHQLTYITTIDELIEWLITELTKDEDITDAINGWLEIYPEFKENKVEIFSRAGHLKSLSEEQNQATKKILLGPQIETGEDKAIPKEKIDTKALGKIITALETYTKINLSRVRNEDKTSIPLGPESPEDNILQRAIDIILKKHGQTILFGIGESKKDATVAQENLEGASLHHSTDPWTNASETVKKNTAELSLVWLMSNDVSVYSEIEYLQKNVHKDSSISTIIAAYSDKIYTTKENEELLLKLAEIRLRWGPITYGSKIYISVNKKTKAKKNQWELYKTLIHEAIHAAENPAFARFLTKYIPKGLVSDIREGIAEYLTLKIWDDVLIEAKALDKDEITLPGEDPETPLKETATNLQKINKELEKDTSYHIQVETIKKLIAALDNGPTRLETAYFAGNVNAFLPKIL